MSDTDQSECTIRGEQSKRFLFCLNEASAVLYTYNMGKLKNDLDKVYIQVTMDETLFVAKELFRMGVGLDELLHEEE